MTLTELAPLGAHDLADRADPVAEVELHELVEALGPGDRREELDGPRVVAQLREGGLALPS